MTSTRATQAADAVEKAQCPGRCPTKSVPRLPRRTVTSTPPYPPHPFLHRGQGTHTSVIVTENVAEVAWEALSRTDTAIPEKVLGPDSQSRRVPAATCSCPLEVIENNVVFSAQLSGIIVSSQQSAAYREERSREEGWFQRPRVVPSTSLKKKNKKE